MAKYLSQRQKVLKIGISSYTENSTVLDVTGNSNFTGIGTFQSDLYVGGNVNIVGVLTAERLYSNIYGEFTGGGIVGDSIVGTALSISGISTLGTVQISSGIITATSGIVTYYGDGSNLTGVAIATYASTAGISTSVIGGIGSLTSLSVSGVTTLGFTTVSNLYVSGITTSDGGFIGNLTGTASTASFATTAFTLNDRVESEFNVATAVTSTNVVGGIGSLTSLSVSGVTTSIGGFIGNLTGTATTATNLADAANITTGTINSARLTGTYNIDISGNAATATYATNAGISTYATLSGIATYASVAGVSTNVVGGIGSLTSLSVSGLSTFTGIGTFQSDLFVGGDVNIVGVLTAERLYSNVYGEFTGGGITGDSIVGTALSISGISTLGTVQISSGIVTATSGVVTYYGDGSNLTGVAAESADSYQFNTGITSRTSASLTGIGSTILTLPSTSGKQYIIHSIHASNVATGNTEVNVVGAFDFDGGERSYFAYSLPLPTGTGIELLIEPQILNPSDRITMRGLDYDKNGTDDVVEVYVTYQELTSNKYFGVGLGTVGLGITAPVGIYTSSTYPSTVQSIRLTNRTDSGGYPVTINITSGINTIRLVNNLIVPKYGSVEILETPKRIEVNDIIQVQVDQGSTIDVQVSGKQIV